MNRFRLAVLLVGLMAAVSADSLLAQAKEIKKDTKNKTVPEKKDDSREKELKAIIDDFVSARRKMAGAMRAAKNDQERKEAEALAPKEADFLPRILKLVDGNPKDAVSCEAFTFMALGLDSKDKKVMDGLLSFADRPEIMMFASMTADGAPDHLVPVMEAILSKNPEKDAKGMACFGLGAYYASKEGAQNEKKAEEYFDRVVKEFAGINGPEGTLGEMAKSSLRETRELGIGKVAPAAECEDLAGKKATLADYKGKVVVLDIWATWCGPCKAMIPHERELVKKMKDKPFVLISVSADNEKQELEDFLKSEPMPWVHWYAGPKGSILKTFNVRFFPTIYVFDAEGKIRYKGVRGKKMDEAVETLLAEMKKK